jgi:hypothetical protein
MLKRGFVRLCKLYLPNNAGCCGVQICALLGYYAALSGSSVPTFRDDLSVPSSRVKKSKTSFLLGLLEP